MTIYVALKTKRGIELNDYEVPGGLGDTEMSMILQDKLVEDSQYKKARVMGWNSDRREISEYMKQRYGSYFKGYKFNHRKKESSN